MPYNMVDHSGQPVANIYTYIYPVVIEDKLRDTRLATEADLSYRVGGQSIESTGFQRDRAEILS